ncbi:MAG: response regulator [Nitrosopumilaceae archaeon]|nr:response regulator [Nitrosopumilaceae archaeon]
MVIVTKSLQCIIIDDDEGIREMLSEILELQGFAVKGTASNGYDGIKIFEEEQPEIVFLDVRMPKMNGIEVLKKIRQKSSNAKVIMITADSSSNIEKTLFEAGANTVIFKPFKIETIQNAVMEAITTSIST